MERQLNSEQPTTVNEHLLGTATESKYAEFYVNQMNERLQKAMKKDEKKKRKVRVTKNPDWVQGSLFP